MKSSNTHLELTASAAWRQRAGRAAAILGMGLGLSLAALAAPIYNAPTTTNPAGLAAPYSWPQYHAGGSPAYTTPADSPLSNTQPTPAESAGSLPFIPYYQAQGTPSGFVDIPNSKNVLVPQPTQIYSDILGNFNAGGPPAGITGTAPNYNLAFFPNHFFNGPNFQNHYIQIDGPLGYLPGNAPFAKNAQSPTPDVQGSPVAVNYTEYNEIASMYYVGEQVTGSFTGSTAASGAPGVGHGTPPGSATPVTAGINAIRQVVYFTRYESVPAIINPRTGTETLGGVPVPDLQGTTTPVVPVGTDVNVGAIYAMDGFTGGIIWRYQLPAFYNTASVTSTPNTLAASLSGTVNSTNSATVSPFQIGPAATNEGSTSLNGNPGTFTVSAGGPSNLPSPNLNVSLYATSAVNNNNGTATYSGTFRIYQGAANVNDGKILSHGSFNLTSTSTNLTSGTVTGTFTADTGTFNNVVLAPYTPLGFTGTFSGTSLSGTLKSLPTGTTLRIGSPVYTSVAVARMNVVNPSTGAGEPNKLVVIAADNNGYVYCLDAVGNGPIDNLAESNTNVVYQDTASGKPNYTTDANIVGQVNYDYQDPMTGYVQNNQPHIGTTFPYWVYRPDPTQPLYGPSAAGSNPGKLEPVAAQGTDHDLPVPQAFGTASPIVYVNPADGQGTVLIGSSNGVLYALNGAGGVEANTATETATPGNLTYAFNLSVTGQPGINDNLPTTNIRWWDSLSGANADTSKENVSIESAPSVYVTGPNRGAVYVGSSDPNGVSAGQVHAVDIAVGPTGNNGTGSIVPGSPNYNTNPVGLWAFPKTGTLGDISGTPAVFTNPVTGQTQIYFGADTGKETIPAGSANAGSVNPESTNTGRIWSINTDGSFNWAYPTATDPNAGAVTATSPPIEGFRLATPAIGMVQFPTGVEYLSTAGVPTPYTHTDSANADIAGKFVPMLYIGTESTATGGNLYALDIDGASDAERAIYAYNAAAGSPSFIGSPALVINPSTAGGNGGAVFITAGNHLLQYQATPISTNSTSAPYPSPRIDYTFPYGGATSSPAVAAAVVSDLTGTNTLGTLGYTTTSIETVTDWVYVGDSMTGQCFGFSPLGFGNDTTGNYLQNIVPTVPPAYNASPIVSQFPIRAFLFNDDTALVNGTDTANMNNALGYGQTSSGLPVFEWGDTVGFRLANVVPPGPPTTTDAIKDPTDPTGKTYFGNGSAITFQTTEVDNSGQNQPGTVDSFTIPPQIITAPLTQNGFIERTDFGTTTTNFGNSSELTNANPPPTTSAAATPRAAATQLLDNAGHGWVACGAYSIGFSSLLDPQGVNRHNTPGSARRIISATQTVTRYTFNGTTFTPLPTNPTFQINLVANPAFSYSEAGTGSAATNDTATQGTLYVDQPTFGILNPLAVRGGGVNVTAGLGSVAAPVGPTWEDTQGNGGIGPFRGIEAQTFYNNANASANGSTATIAVDMEALANGNNVDTSPPPSGVLALNATTGGGANPTTPAQNALVSNQLLAPYYRYIITTTGQVEDGTTGDNSNLITTQPIPTPGQHGTFYPNGVPSGSTDPASYGQYLLDIADRSQLGLSNNALHVSIQQQTLGWQDNTGKGGPGARINPLPWDDIPYVNQNSSADYPNIPAIDLNYGNGIGSNSPLPPAVAPAVGAAPWARIIQPEPVQVSVSVPKYQPANLQLWQLGTTVPPVTGGIPPNQAETATPEYSTSNYNYPDGYAAKVRVAVASNGFANPNDPNAAYRSVYIYTGVPVDISTSITNSVTDVGVVPGGFGEQMSTYTPSGTAVPIGAFSPYSDYPGYAGHFQPLNIISSSNVNLIDPALDQKINTNGGTGQSSPLPLLSDSLDSSTLDPNSYIPAYDFTGIAGPTGTLPGSTTLALPYLVRSTLDTDLAELYGQNPLAKGNADYPVVTFHKPRVGDTTGTTMTVPDVDRNDGALTPVENNTPPKLNAAGTGPAFATQPYVGVEVPFGTPVGTYSQNLRLFEGYDPNYNPLIGPTYGGVSGGYGAFNPLALNTFDLQYYNGVPHALQPYSNPATQIKVSVEESQLTNGFTPGALPMIDLTPTGNTGKGTVNYAPFAYRDPKTGSLNLFWTTSRGYTVGGTNPLYDIAGASLLFNSTSSPGYFQPAATNQWWSPISSFPLAVTTPPSSNLGWSVALTQAPFGSAFGPDTNAATAYGFDTNLLSQSPYTSTINCYAVTPATGVLGGFVPVASSPQPKGNVRGLSFTGVAFNDPNNGAQISNSLWSFWTGGTRGQTAIYYSPAAASANALRFGTDVNGTETPGQYAVLPVPAGLVAISHPSPVLTDAPMPGTQTGAAIPVIEVTYSGVGANGSSNLYLSRYQPYRPLIAGKPDAGSSPASQVLLGLVPFPSVIEALQPNPGTLWWQARDVGWERNNLSFQVAVTDNNVTDTVLVNETGPATYTGTFTQGTGAATNISGSIVYDRASGLLIFTNVTLPRANGTGFLPPALGQTITVDPAQGRIRFSVPLPVASPNSTAQNGGAYASVTASISATARRITTSPAADTEPTSFIDSSYEPNESGVATDPNIQADRYWFIWRRAGAGNTNPTLYYKTQRLTVALTDTKTGQPASIGVVNGVPQVTVKLGGTPLYTPGGGTANVVDVDATRGRLYFPIVYSGTALEGQQVTISGTDTLGNPLQTTGYVEWLDEPIYNDTSNQTSGVSNPAQPGILPSTVSAGYQIPMNASINESGASAFLDPFAYSLNSQSANGYPHKVWLFWTSTRNGVSDLYHETINPRFSAVTGSGGP